MCIIYSNHVLKRQYYKKHRDLKMCARLVTNLIILKIISIFKNVLSLYLPPFSFNLKITHARPSFAHVKSAILLNRPFYVQFYHDFWLFYMKRIHV